MFHVTTSTDNMSDGASAAPVDGDGLHRLHHPNRSSHTRIHAHNSHAKESQPLVQPHKHSASSSLAAPHNTVSTNRGPPSHPDGSSGVGSGTGTQGGAISQGRSRAASRASSVARSRAASAAAAALSRLGTPVGSAFNLVISAAGAGLLSYPFAMRSQGWLLNIVRQTQPHTLFLTISTRHTVYLTDSVCVPRLPNTRAMHAPRHADIDSVICVRECVHAAHPGALYAALSSRFADADLRRANAACAR